MFWLILTEGILQKFPFRCLWSQVVPLQPEALQSTHGKQDYAPWEPVYGRELPPDLRWIRQGLWRQKRVCYWKHSSCSLVDSCHTAKRSCPYYMSFWSRKRIFWRGPAISNDKVLTHFELSLEPLLLFLLNITNSSQKYLCRVYFTNVLVSFGASLHQIVIIWD